MAGPDPIHPVILCGGTGARLWPLSRRARPKQLVSLSGECTMLQRTALRTLGRLGFAAPLVVAAAEDGEAIAAQLGEIGADPAWLVLEPAARNTAPAIALAALAAEADGGEEALLLVMPSDHEIGDTAAFHAAVARARSLAEKGWVVTFGIAPTRPETGYGYIEQGEPLGDGLFRAARFAEKPDAGTAAAWLAEGGWSWNSGLFLLRAGTCLDLLAAHAPEILAAVRAAVANGLRDRPRLLPDPGSFAAAPSVSIDKAVMEKAERVAVAPVEMGWSDVGSWEAVHALGPHDAQGNLVAGDAVALDSRNCLVRSDGPVVVALGVDDLVIVATERAVLVVPRGQTQRVKEAIDALERRHASPPS